MHPVDKALFRKVLSNFSKKRPMNRLHVNLSQTQMALHELRRQEQSSDKALFENHTESSPSFSLAKSPRSISLSGSLTDQELRAGDNPVCALRN